MSEFQAQSKVDDRERFDDNPAIASNHLVSENADGKIIPTGIGDQSFTLSNKITNEPMLPNMESEEPLQPGLSQKNLGWDTSSANPLYTRAAELDAIDLKERQEAAQILHESFKKANRTD